MMRLIDAIGELLLRAFWRAPPGVAPSAPNDDPLAELRDALKRRIAADDARDGGGGRHG